MDVINTIKSALRKADPQNNPNMHDRRAALSMAHKLMDKHHVSFASLGMSMDEAQRIENQDAVSVAENRGGGSQRKAWFGFGGGNKKTSGGGINTSFAYGNGTKSAGSESYNNPASPDYQYQVNYDETNNGYWDGSS